MCIFFFVEREKKNMARRFEIVDAKTRQYRRFNAEGRQLTVLLNSRTDAGDPV